MTSPSSIENTPAPGAVQPAAIKPVVWWAAGGMGLIGAGALAAALATGPKTDATPTTGKPVASTSAKSAKQSGNHTTTVASASTCTQCGTVESVKAEKKKGEATGLGAVGGAVLGGVVGHQMGGGNGKKALTVLGAVGGGLAGNEVEKQARSTTTYQVQLRMDDGSTRTVQHASAPAVGARFEVEGAQLKPLPAAKG
ncbi:MAG: glycine zipper 2TM domain-containing protein [Rhizobacter sp.]